MFVWVSIADQECLCFSLALTLLAILLVLFLRGRYSINQPNALGMRNLLFTCDSYANEFDIVFNASKSKFLVCISVKLRSMFNNLN